MKGIKTIYNICDDYGYLIGTVHKVSKHCYVSAIVGDEDTDRMVMFKTLHAASQYVKDFVASEAVGLTIPQYLRTLAV